MEGRIESTRACLVFSVGEPGEEGLAEDSPKFAEKLREFDERMEHYLQHRLYPALPDWPAICFYPMSKKRQGEDNWYALDYEERRNLMKGHATTEMVQQGTVTA